MNAKETMKKATEKTKEWAASHPKTVRFGRALIAGALRQIVSEEPAPEAPKVSENAVLTADQVNALQGMSCWQLATIFKGKHATFASDPETLKAVSRLSCWQIDAILDLDD